MNRKRMRHFPFYFFILVLIHSCKVENNNRFFENLDQEFSDSVRKNNAKSFNFQFDGLTEQESFFINGKIKYLKYQHRPENGSIEYLIYFDLKTDSISKMIRREIRFETEDENYSDSTFIFSNYLKNYQSLVNNKLADSSSAIRKVKIDKEFIKVMKSQTEKKYNGI